MGAEGPDRERREDRRRLRNVKRLRAVMAAEGAEYSSEKYRGYRARMITGAVLTAVGGLAFITGIVYGAVTIFQEIEADHMYGGDEPSLFEERRIVLHSLFWGGLCGLAIGIPVMVSGLKGRNRQNLLRDKDSIIREGTDIRVGLGYDPSAGFGAISFGFGF